MDLYMCNSCGHAQLLDVVPPDVLFGNYIYTSSSSPDLDNHFTSYSEFLLDRFELNSSHFIIDIGSNDGLFLSKFIPKGIKVLGIDPAKDVASIAISKGIVTVISYLNDDVVQKVALRYGKADIVTANNVFSHTDDLHSFALCVKDLLKESGVFFWFPICIRY